MFNGLTKAEDISHHKVQLAGDNVIAAFWFQYWGSPKFTMKWR